MNNISAEPLRCTAAKSHGRFCDRESLPDAPFPICIRHASQLLAYLNDCAPGGFEDRILVGVRAIQQARENEEERKRRSPDGPGSVYYVQVGNLVKIGHSTALKSRLNAYPPGSKLLATETGDVALEVRRHNQFKAYRAARNEWYRPAPELMAHIDRVRSGNVAA